MLKMVDGTGIIGVDMICPLGVSTPQPPNYDRVELEGTGMLVLPNSLDAPLERLELGGKTEQVQTTGAQLFEAKNAELNKWVDSTGIIATVGRNCIFRLNVKPNTVYQVNILSASCTFSFSQFSKENVFLERTVFSKGTKSFKCTTTENVDYAYFLIGGTVDNINGIINDVMLYEGEEYKNYEPYTGGKPSPSPEYPQEIKNSGKWNEETQKYEVDVKVTGKNLFNREKAKDVSKWTPCAFNANFAEIAVYVGTGSTVTASNNVKIDNPVYYYGVALKSSEDIKYFICYPGYPNSKDTHTFTATEDYIYVRCNKTSLNDVIGVCGGLQIEIGASRTDFEPYKEQTLTLTSDRPITKWDRLVEQGGQIGWLYKSKIDELPKTGYRYIETGYFSKGNVFTDSALNSTVTPGSQFFTCFSLANPSSKKGDIAWLYVNKPGTTDLRVRFADESINTIELFEKYMADKDMKILYETAQTEFVPLPQSEQNAIRALKTYYPTTVITADGGELDPDIKVTYRKEI